MSKFAMNESYVERQLRHPEATLNYELGLAYEHDPKDTLAKMASCCLVNERSFYGDTTSKVFDLIKRVGEDDPIWLLKLAVFLREELKLRSISQYITAVCLTLPEAKPLIKRAFNRLTPRTDDLIEIAALLKDGRYGLTQSLPSVARELIADRLNNLSEIDFIKYRRSRSFGLKHLIRIVHPKPSSQKQKLLFWYALSRKNFSDRLSWDHYELLPQILCFEELIRTPRRHTNKICHFIEEGKLPWEVVLPIAGSRKKVWSSVVKSLPIMALIRNLRNLYKHGVLKDPELRKFVLDKLSNKDIILNSKQLPFRWLSAYRVMEAYDQEIADALLGALEISTANLSKFSGTTFISADNSGSMYGEPVSSHSWLGPADIANLLGAMIFHISEKGFTSVFAEDFAMVPVSQKDSIMTNWEKMESTDVGYTTYAYKAIAHLLRNRIHTDRIIVLTDMIIYSRKGWDEDSANFMWLLEKYRRRVNPQVKTYIINLQPYEYFISPSDDLGVTTISGWSESILKYIECDSNPKNTTMTDIIGRIKL